MWPRGLRGRPRNYINQGRFRPHQRTKKTVRRATRYYTTLCIGLAPLCLGLRGREKPELYRTHESREARRISDDSVPWDGLDETCENREASQNKDALVPWDGPDETHESWEARKN